MARRDRETVVYGAPVPAVADLPYPTAPMAPGDTLRDRWRSYLHGVHQTTRKTHIRRTREWEGKYASLLICLRCAVPDDFEIELPTIPDGHLRPRNAKIWDDKDWAS